MAIRFRCEHCQTLMSIASRKAGLMVQCPACDEDVLVPREDQVTDVSPPTVALAPLPVPPVVTAPPVDVPKFEMSTDRGALPDDFFDFDDDEIPSATPPRPADTQREELSAEEEEFATFQELAALASAEDSAAAEETATPHPVAPPRRTSSESPAEKFTVPLRKAGIDDEMDLTPMVDVVFQLLIFFMVTASFALHKTIQTPTPEENQKGATQSIQSLDELEGVSILVRIDGQNGIFIDDDPLLDDSRVGDALRDKMRKELKSEIIITADSAAWHRTVVKVVDAANEVGMQKIRLATRSGSVD